MPTLRLTPSLLRSMIALLAITYCSSVSAEVRLPAIFGSKMVLQQKQPLPVWGKASAGENVTVEFGGQSASATANADGDWRVSLQPLDAGGPHKMVVKGSNQIVFDDVLIGEVWVCSGQSNMAWNVKSANDPDLERLTANFPNIRLISVPQVGTQEPQFDFDGEWQVCSPKTVDEFSAVGYFFGRQLHQTLNVPIGLIDNAWGGSAAEAWVRRDVLAANDHFGDLLARWKKTEEAYDHDAVVAQYEKKVAQWQENVAAARAAGKRIPAKPRAPRNPLAGQHRPANLYNGVLLPTIGFAIKGAIWYQGESNAGQAYQYRELFPLMIQHWRDEWKQGDFPFYWVQLADFRAEVESPIDSSWAELREAQTMTMSKLANTGEAVILNLGESSDIHPKNKQDVAKRLARWALAKDYGVDIVFRSPIYKSNEIQGEKVIVEFDHAGGGLDTFDVRDLHGFTIAGDDKKFVPAQAKFVGPQPYSKVEVWNDSVVNPVAVRYAWADNPVCNVQNKEGLPVTPFRTDDWPGMTAGVTAR